MPKEVTNLQILGYLETITAQLRELHVQLEQVWSVLSELGQADQSDSEDDDVPSSQHPRLV